jgi:carbon monoxide dehydrogenase subunit G
MGTVFFRNIANPKDERRYLMVIKETAATQARSRQAWDILIDPGQIGRCVRGVEMSESSEPAKTYRSIVRVRFSRATLKEAESTIGCA